MKGWALLGLLGACGCNPRIEANKTPLYEQLVEAPGWGVMVIRPTMQLHRLEADGWSPAMRPADDRSPPPRRLFSAAIDEAQARLVVFGGFDDEEGCLGDTWVFEDGAWRELEGPGPSPRDLGRMWFDRQSGMIRLQGGSRVACGGTVLHGEWALEGDHWRQTRRDVRWDD